MLWLCNFLMFVGRICIGAIFLFMGVDKLIHYQRFSEAMVDRGISLIPLFLIGAFVIEVIGGLSLILGYRARWGALLLIIYLIPATLLFQNFWEYSPGPERHLHFILFLKNLALFGGLLYILAAGPKKSSCGNGNCCH